MMLARNLEEKAGKSDGGNARLKQAWLDLESFNKQLKLDENVVELRKNHKEEAAINLNELWNAEEFCSPRSPMMMMPERPAGEGPGSPYGDDVFYECVSPRTERIEKMAKPAVNFVTMSGESYSKKNVNIKMGTDNKAAPLFSALRSPNGIRKRIKWFFLQYCQEDIERTESLVADVSCGYITEKQVFAMLEEEYVKPRASRKKKEDLLVEDLEEEEEEKEEEEDVEEEEDDLYISLTAASVSKGKSSVRFSDTVLSLATDVSGIPLGPRIEELKEPHIVTKLTPASQRPVVYLPNGKRKKTKKRRIKRLTAEDKELLYEWRADLRPAKAKLKKAVPLVVVKTEEEATTATSVEGMSPTSPDERPLSRSGSLQDDDIVVASEIKRSSSNVVYEPKRRSLFSKSDRQSSFTSRKFGISTPSMISPPLIKKRLPKLSFGTSSSKLGGAHHKRSSSDPLHSSV